MDYGFKNKIEVVPKTGKHSIQTFCIKFALIPMVLHNVHTHSV